MAHLLTVSEPSETEVNILVESIRTGGEYLCNEESIVYKIENGRIDDREDRDQISIIIAFYHKDLLAVITFIADEKRPIRQIVYTSLIAARDSNYNEPQPATVEITAIAKIEGREILFIQAYLNEVMRGLDNFTVNHKGTYDSIVRIIINHEENIFDFLKKLKKSNMW